MQQQQVLIWKARQENIWLTCAVRNNGGGFYNHNLLECNDSNGGGLQQEIY
jgi:hypothetical protein